MLKPGIASSENSLVINYAIPELDAESFADENGNWFRIGIPGHIPSSTVGKPEMPVLSRLIIIPTGYSWKIKISDIKTERIKPSSRRIRGNLFPVQEGETKVQQQGKPAFAIDRDLYSSRRYIESDTVKIEPVGTARGKKLATLSVSPVRYNPRSNVIDVITSMKIEVIFIGSGADGQKSLIPESLLLGDNLEKGTLNYEPEDLITGYSDKPVRMMILTDTAYKKHLQPLIEWKTQKGFRLDILYKGADFAGVNYLDIKNSIAEIYNSSNENNPPPDYLLIVGNTLKIPYYGTGNVTDLYYGEFDGSGDYIPEMFIGRLPVADTNDLKAVVSKIIQYEKFEFADTNRFHSNALATAGVDESHKIHMNGQVNYTVSNYLTPSNRITEFNFLYPNAKKDTIIKLINRGLSFINYTGHGSSTGWLYLNIENGDVPSLKNKNMYPFVISNACQTSRFNTTSFGNTLVLASQKGAIGYIGCSADSYWDEDYYWSVGVGPVSLTPTYQSTGLGALDRLFHTHGESPSDWYVTMGQINYAGNLAVSASTTSKKKYYWEIYNLVGDPSITPIIGTPDTFKIALPDTLPDNMKSYSFIAEPFSYIAVSHFDTLWDASHASPSGAVTLEMPGLSNDSCLVVITGQNKVPLIKTIYFSSIPSSFVNLSGSAINDSLENSNGKADYNETIFLKLTIENLGSVSASAVSAVISSSSSFVTIDDGYANIGTILAGKEVILHNDLRFSLNGDIPDNSVITFDLKLKEGASEKLYKIDIPVHSPDLAITHYTIDDSETGNSNFIADPGENIVFLFNVANLGSSNASGVFSISSPDPEISLIEPSKASGILTAGNSVQVPLQAKISASTAEGTTVSLTAEINCDPFITERSFKLRIGRFQETFESSSFRIFPWINVSEKPWTLTQSSPYEGIVSAKSGVIGDNQSTILAIKANYSIADSVRFYYKVSSETGYDNFHVRVNGVEMLKKSGDIPWTRTAVGVNEGMNIIEWIYKKDGSVSSGTDCAWIDLIDFAALSPVKYITRDIMAARIASPLQSPTMGIENVSVSLLNLGPDTIKGFNLAYSINSGPPVIQHFRDNLIYGGDTVTVSFTAKANLSTFGDYELEVFSFGNNDDNLLNDTLKTVLKNRVRRTGENERGDGKNDVLIAPNPFTDKINILIISETEKIVHLSLVSTAGKRILDRKEFQILQGENPITLDGFLLEPAVYNLIIDYPAHSSALKVVKVKQ
jgi:hypothetical protein